MDNAYERLTRFLGSTTVVVLFTAWLILHTIMQRDYLSFISELAILLGFLILRGQNVQSDRMEANVRADLKKSDLQIRLLRALNSELKQQRWMK